MKRYVKALACTLILSLLFAFGIGHNSLNSAIAKTSAPVLQDVDKGNTTLNNYAKEVLRLVNVERMKAGLKPLTTNSTISKAANKRAKEIVKSFSHTRPNKTPFYTVFKEYKLSYKAAGENIAYGQKSPKEVVTTWMKSSGHRANILSKKFGKIGVGVYKSGGRLYWTQIFTN